MALDFRYSIDDKLYADHEGPPGPQGLLVTSFVLTNSFAFVKLCLTIHVTCVTMV